VRENVLEKVPIKINQHTTAPGRKDQFEEAKRHRRFSKEEEGQSDDLNARLRYPGLAKTAKAKKVRKGKKKRQGG